MSDTMCPCMTNTAIAYSKLGSWISLGISQDLMVRLSELDLLLQLNIQLVKVNSEVMSLGGCEASFRVNSDVWVVSFICKER